MPDSPLHPGGATLRLDLRRPDGRFAGALAVVSATAYPALETDCAAFLHADELECFRSLEFDRRRASYLLGRYAAKQALTNLSRQADQRSVAVLPGIFDQPVVRGLAGLSVSISHADRLACAVAFPEDHPMAIDVEDMAPHRVSVMARELTEAEKSLGRTLVPEAVHHTVLWTAKEALSKILRTGMMTPLSVFAVETLELASVPLPLVGWDGGECLGGQYLNFAQYRFQSWIGDGSVISMALPRRTTLRFQPVL